MSGPRVAGFYSYCGLCGAKLSARTTHVLELNKVREHVDRHRQERERQRGARAVQQELGL